MLQLKMHYYGKVCLQAFLQACYNKYIKKTGVKRQWKKTEYVL